MQVVYGTGSVFLSFDGGQNLLPAVIRSVPGTDSDPGLLSTSDFCSKQVEATLVRNALQLQHLDPMANLFL
jgi:hypothetical protein